MKKTISLIIGFNIAVLLTCHPSFAQQKNISLNAENLVKASKIINQNKAFFSNPELMQRYQRLASTLAKKKQK